MKRLLLIYLMFISSLAASQIYAQVKYDEGRLEIMGIQLLQDNNNPLSYYYLPKYPKLSRKDDGSYEFLCLKYVGADKATSGGLFHALIEYSLPDSLVKLIGKELENKKPGAFISGMVPLMQAFKDGQDGVGSFEVVSAILSKQGDNQTFTRSVITSGHAPLTPGSKAVVAAMLAPEGATLLWNSMQGPTSDVSVTLHAYYEAVVKSYNAVVTADVSTIYTHFSKISNTQQEYTKSQLRKIVDDLKQNSSLKIEVFDRSSGLGIKENELSGILQLVTDKLIELMFDAQTGWAKEPEREVAVEPGQLKGRQNESWFSQTFLGPSDTKYYTDNQYVIKKREDIRTKSFYLNLSQSTTIKVPVYSSGNLGGLYKELGNDNRYFRIVDMNDPAFELRDIHFQIDGDYVESFNDIINFATVNFRKKYEIGQNDRTGQVVLDNNDVKKGITVKDINYPRLGLSSSDWLKYDYQVSWSIKGENKTIKIPEGTDRWIAANAPAIALKPPFDIKSISIDADRQMFKDSLISTGIVDFATVLIGTPRKSKSVTLRANDAASTTNFSLYHDIGAPIYYVVTWYNKLGKKYKSSLQTLDTDYLYLVPPPAGQFK
jgi:hypothetical protein